ncbi:MAG: histidine kinase [Cyclobacteriaceae bacterium]
MTDQINGKLKQSIMLFPKWVKWVIQVAYWTSHLGLMILLYASLELGGTRELILWSLITGSFTLFIFYSFFYFIIPKYLGKRNSLFILLTIVYFVVYPLLKYFIDQQLGLSSLTTIQLNPNGEDASDAFLFGQEIGRRLFTPLWNIPFALFARFMVDWFKNKQFKIMMETQQLKSELALLRNQVNPHFLFNVLNNIDTMVYPHSEEASEAIMKLSSIMRYMLYESDADMVNIEKEITYLKAYIDLQRMRLKLTDKIVFNIDDSLQDVKIAPMLLIPFVENAFKHATRIDQQLTVEVQLQKSTDTIDFTVINSHDPAVAEEKDKTGGIGLSNVKKRLALIYPDRHTLDITSTSGLYQVNLTITPERL